MATSASELVIRPTGLVDPPISVRPATAQVDDLFWQIKEVVAEGGRVLVTTLTKKMAQDLTTYYHDLGIKVHYLHADVTTLERVELLRRLRQGVFSVLIGINLLREGLDIPEVALVAVLDADREGFLRSRSSLIQITGRAARNQKARAIFYADTITPSMAEAIAETDRRRHKQIAYNTAHGITPQTVVKSIPDDMRMMFSALAGSPTTSAREALADSSRVAEEYRGYSQEKLRAVVRRKEKAMKKMASQMKFEEAAILRDELAQIEVLLLAMLKE
jgi:excinuclease ABC subunit B